ncbi:MAG: hypothetical protein K0S53_509 [Bacteroidetes bacterium]|jgi:hypothetical protein|nr:hypothetical protein [Bacteroidota bacterium]MDF2451874.1 hypothetical protein [Bacteroidota bacterium]
MTRFLISTVLFFVLSGEMISQGCCSGGSGSPIAGGASQGVLQDRQAEVSVNYQYLSSNRFLVGERDTARLFDNLSSNYLYGRLAYGVTKDLTISVETGYFLNKTQIGLRKIDTINSSGFGDLIIFPRYDILNRTTEAKRTEITLGMGYKIPIGTYNDSTVVYTNPTTGQKYYTTSPPTVQPTTGSQDFIFYGFAFQEYTKSKFRIFANALYIKKGWNPLGQKFGDYSSIGLFVGKTFFRKLGVVLQVKGEHISKMKYDKNVDMLALYNIDVKSTGSRKLFFVPQLSFSHKLLTIYALAELPLYQFVYGTQVASQHQVTTGISYRFFTVKPKE